MKPTNDEPHSPVSRVRHWIDSHTLLRSEGETTVSLSRALAMLNGARIDEPDTAAESLARQIGAYDHYLFVIVDGLGMNQREHFLDSGFFSAHLAKQIRSVFPSTTAAALTSFHSGEWPAKHAVTGWFTHLPDHGATVLPLRAIERFTEKPLRDHGIPFADVVGVPSRFQDMTTRVKTYTFRKFTTGPYGKWSSAGTEIEGYRSLDNAVRRIRRGLKHPGEPSFNYLYLSQVDHLSHLHGSQSKETIREIKQTDRALKRLRAILPESVRIVVTADHGHIDLPRERLVLLKHDDPLLDLLECPPSGEARVPLFHVKPGHEDAFAEGFRRTFVDRYGLDFVLITPDDAESLGLYGPAPLSPRTRERLGTFIGISPSADGIEYLAEGNEPVGLIGMHGGMSPDEVEVPLFLA